MRLAFYESQAPFSEAPGAICSYVIQRARVLGGKGFEVWWFNRNQQARWDPGAEEWVERRDERPGCRGRLAPANRKLLERVDFVEVPENALWAAALPKEKLVVHWHTAPSVRGWLNREKSGPIAAIRTWWRERQLFERARHILAPSSEVCWLQAGRHGIHPDKVTVLPHVFAEEPSREAGARVAGGYVLMVGNLEYFKGFDLVAAGVDRHLRRSGSLKLYFAGTEGAADPNPQVCGMLGLKAVRELLERHGEGGVRFLGRVGHDRLGELYRHANATIVGSRFESYSMVAAEAAGVGCPVLLSRRAGLRELALGCGGARLIDPYDPEDIADALDEMADPEQRPHWMAASRRLSEHIRSEELAQRTARFYRSMVQS